MRISVSQLRRIIREEVTRNLMEARVDTEAGYHGPQEWHHSSPRATKIADEIIEKEYPRTIPPTSSGAKVLLTKLKLDFRKKEDVEDLGKAFDIVIEQMEGEDVVRTFFKSSPGKDYASRMMSEVNYLHMTSVDHPMYRSK